MTLVRSIANTKNRLVHQLRLRMEDFRFSKTAPVIAKNTLLILRLDSIGDYILFRNFIEPLKKSDKYKNYSITLCGNSWWKDLSENLDAGCVDDFIWVDYNQMLNLDYRKKIFRQIHQRGFDTLIHPSYSRDVISDAVVSKSGAKNKIGYAGDLINLTAKQKAKNDKAYNLLIPAQQQYQFEFYRDRFFFERLLGGEILLKKPTIDQPKAEENKIIICPGAKDDFRRWSPQNFAELCNRLTAHFPNMVFAICGASSDSGLAKQIMQATSLNFTDYTGKLNLVELKDIFAQAKLVITNDSGPFHLAVALNKKVVCISNGNNYGRFTPYPQEMQTASVVIYPEALLNIPTEEERLRRYCRSGSALDINTIEVQRVYDIICLNYLAD